MPGAATSDGCSGHVVVLAVDYGFMMTLPKFHLAPLPPECRGIPPQVLTAVIKCVVGRLGVMNTVIMAHIGCSVPVDWCSPSPT